MQRVGQGGMGDVWLAEQTAPIRRRVALKVIKPGMDSRQVVARFEAERQALALMNHSCVAKVYDAGTTPEGRPFFAMEYVPGAPITEYCARHHLGLRDRLLLFRRVCDGVQHTHHKAIIHRDLKPGNVLVMEEDGEHQPKIIDFGVAKATSQKLTEQDTALGYLINDPDVEAVVIALPLHLHAKVAIECMQAGKHVLTEKLMGHNVAQCKVMSRVAEETGLYLATGHQRHYSVLYDNAVNLLRWGLLGQIHHIRAQWHRGNLPGNDSWQQPLPGGEVAIVDGKPGRIDKIAERLKKLEDALKKEKDPAKFDLLKRQIAQWAAWNEDQKVQAADYDYRD